MDPKQAPATQEEEEEEAAAAAEAAAARRAAARPVDAQELLREAEEAAGDAGMEMLDARGLKRLTLALERKVGGWVGVAAPVWVCVAVMSVWAFVCVSLMGSLGMDGMGGS